MNHQNDIATFQTRIVSLRFTLFVLCAAGGLPISHAAERAIENEWMRVRFSDGSLSLTPTKVKDASIPALTFPGEVKSAVVGKTKDPVWGAGEEILITQASGWKTAVRLFDTSPFAQFVVTAGNSSGAPMSMKRAEIFSYEVDLGVPLNQLRMRGTDGLKEWGKSPGSYTYSAIADPESRRGIVAACLTHEIGVGAFFPGGLDRRSPGKVLLRTDFGQFNIAPGAERPVDTYVIGFFNDARIGLETYADTVAKHLDIQLKEEPNVHCTWYYAGSSDEKRFQANTEFVAANLNKFGLNVMQIDDGWQTPKRAEEVMYQGKAVYPGPHKQFTDLKKRYPSGMAHTAAMVKSHGMVPGIWFIPFSGDAWNSEYFDHDLFVKNADGDPFMARWSGSPLDLSQENAREFLKQRVQRIHGWGYRYFKVDGMHIGAATALLYVNQSYNERGLTDAVINDPMFTYIMNYRMGLKILREHSPDTYILGCNLSQAMYAMGPAFGKVDGMRVGPDNGSAKRGLGLVGVRTGNWHGSNLYFLHGRIWHNDPDPVYVVPYVDRGNWKGIKEHLAHWMVSWLAVSGSMITTSVEYAKLPPERLDILKRTMPSHSELARPVDYFENDNNRIWITGNKRMNVLGIFNWEDKESTVTYDMGKMGLESDSAYVAFDFWENEFVAPFKGTLNETLPAEHCRVLALRKAADHPQVISTSRHITQGLMDILEETWNGKTNTLTGKSKVVAGDPYELRITLSDSSKFKPKSASFGGQQVEVGNVKDGGVRVRFTPAKSGTVDWNVTF